MMWGPVLQIEEKSIVLQFEAKIKEIADVLIQTVQNPNTVKPLGLLDGNIGIAHFLFYYSRYLSDKALAKIAIRLLEKVVEQSHDNSKSLTFSTGISGIAWGLIHLSENSFIKTDTNIILEEIDLILFESMKTYIDDGYYDFLHGALGIGLYFLSNKKKISDNYLNYLVNTLDNNAIKNKDGIAWESLLDPDSGLTGYNFGLSHGMPSIIIFLSKLYKHNICKEKVESLVNGAIDFIFENQLPPNDLGLYFPSWISKEGKSIPSRLAWCYGDLGIGIALWQTSINMKNKTLNEKALDILLSASLRRNLEKEHVVDAGLCHGSIGIAHIFGRMYNYTQNNKFKLASIFWYKESLNMAKFTDGLAGYKAYKKTDWENNFSLIEGITGIGLSMISAISYIEPAWDECFLIS